MKNTPTPPLLNYALATLATACICLCLTNCSIISGNTTAPNPSGKAVNQNTIHKNGCGISSLITAYRFAKPKWQIASKTIPGTSDAQKFHHLANNFGNTKSKYTPSTRRWTPSSGISSIDLKDLANDYQNTNNLKLPNLRLTTHHIQRNDNHTTLLKRTHQHLKTALKSGFPPILSIKHLKTNKIEGHLVTLYQLPSSIPSNATSFPIKYIDPLGGIIKEGTIHIPTNTNHHKSIAKYTKRTLAMQLPQSDIANNNNTKKIIVLSSSITL